MKKAGNKFLLVAVILIAIASCKKSSDNPPVTPTGTVVGFWAGTGTLITSSTPQSVAIVFKSDKTMRFYLGAAKAADTAAVAAANKADGTYTVSGTNITSTYSLSGVLLLLAATANNSFTTLNGTAGLSPASSGVGTFTFTKQ